MADLTTLGIKLGYAIETTAGEMPTEFKWLPRCRAIGGISLSQETIDTSCLEDLVAQYAKGRSDTGGEWEVTFLSGAIKNVITMFNDSKEGEENGLATWFEVWIPNFEEGAFFLTAQPGETIPMPDISDNSALEFPISLTINKYNEFSTAIEPVEMEDTDPSLYSNSSSSTD